MTNFEDEIRANPFMSEDPEIRGRLAHLSFACACALLEGDMERVHIIRGEAMLLKALSSASHATE